MSLNVSILARVLAAAEVAPAATLWHILQQETVLLAVKEAVPLGRVLSRSAGD